MNYALLLTALFNGAWQGAVLCAAAYFAFQRVRGLNATTMFAVWSVLLAMALALPVANYVFATRPYTVHVAAVTESAAVSPAQVQVHQSAQPAVKPAPLAFKAAATAVVHTPAIPLREIATSVVTSILDRAWMVLVFCALIGLLRLSILGRDLAGMFAARRAAKRIEPPFPTEPLSRPYQFATSEQLKSPCVLGFSPALIVIPEELLEAPQSELLSVVLHEREHVRRYDDVQNVAFRFVSALAFFCPGVRLALRELALYREQICDDAAVNGIGDPVTYAMTLTGLAQWAQGRGVPVPSLIFKRKQLLHRLEMLLDRAVNHSLRTNRRFACSACAAIVLAAAIVLRFQVPVIAQVPAPAPKPPHAVSPPRAAPRVPKALAKAPPTKAAVAPAPPHSTPCPLEEARLRLEAPVPPHVETIPSIRPVRIAVAKTALVAATAPLVRAETQIRVAAFTAAATATTTSSESSAAVAPVAVVADNRPELLDALQAAGLRNLSVNDLIALKDHGVTPTLLQAATAYFGTGVTAGVLTKLADHGVSSLYLQQLRSLGLTGIAPDSVITLLDHGVNAELMRSAYSYFRPAPSAPDLVSLSDHGVTASSLESLRRYGILGVPLDAVVRMADHGVAASYAAKVRRTNPNATIDDIIRLHDAGF